MFKYLKNEWVLLFAALTWVIAFNLEHSAITQGGIFLGSLFTLVFGAIILLAFRIAHHAEVLAVRFGEPYGTLILTSAAVTVEVVILAVMFFDSHNPTLARDTVFAAVMLDINGILGIAAIVGGLKYGVQKYNLNSSSAYISTMLVALGIGLFIPEFVPDEKWKVYSVFSIIIMSILYVGFLRLQTVEHRDFFEHGEVEAEAHDKAHSPNWYHIGALLVSIIAVGALSELLSVFLDHILEGTSMPKTIPAVVIALISASPEFLTAINAAKHNRLQTTVNIALGASLATVLLTIPIIEAIALITDSRIEMGMTPMQSALVLLTLLAAKSNLQDGESNTIEGMTHFALFAVFVALTYMGLT